MKARGANCAGTNHETSTTTNAILENEKEENFDTSFSSFGSSPMSSWIMFCSKIKRENQRREREKTLEIENYAMKSAPQIDTPCLTGK